MLNLFSSKKPVNLVIDDYALRMVEAEGNGQVKKLMEKVVPAGLIEHGQIADEMEFFNFMQETVKEWGIKRRKIRFYAPDSLVIMKKVSFPANLKDKDDILGHFNLELGRSLYLPFENPIIDIEPLEDQNEDGSEPEGILFAVPEEEIRKYTEVFADCRLYPVAADVRPIGIYRYFLSNYTEPLEDKAFLFMEVNLKSISFSIFSNHRPEFMRFLELDVEAEDWEAKKVEEGHLDWVYHGDWPRLEGVIIDQIMELERIMNFYRFSIHKGEKAITHVILLGDFPKLDHFYEHLEKHLSVPVIKLKGQSSRKNDSIPRSYIPALGLALKGEQK